MTGKRVAHRFGGVWTEIKLKALTEYLWFYQNALKNQGFDTWYIDAFAGTGDRHAKVQTGGLFGEDAGPIHHIERILDGSARKALKIDPPFAHYWFAERQAGRARQLNALRDEFSLDITVQRGEANDELRGLLASPPWSGGYRSGQQRAVVFLDPYGLSVDWATLKMLADTRRVDVWYLFPRNAVLQQLANTFDGVDDAKRRKLDQIFGGPEWVEEFYRAQPAQHDLFGGPAKGGMGRKVDSGQIAAFARAKLRTLFCYVSEPLPLIVKGRDYFELYCLSNNGPAVPLIKKGVDHVIRKYMPASHRTAGHPEGDR